MGAIQFVENLDRTTLTITDEEFEKNVEAAVSAIAEKHQLNSPPLSQQPTFDEKAPPPPDSRPSFDDQYSSRKSYEGTGEDTLPIGGLLKTIQKPLSTIGRIFSDDGGQASASSPQQQQQQQRPSRSRDTGEVGSAQRPPSRHTHSAEEAAARQASAEAAEAQRLQRAEHANVVETLSGMFPDLDKEIISDVVHQKQGRLVSPMLPSPFRFSLFCHHRR
jgi:Rab5 GDP/GTP exchange factor